jgi:hypothetical protein
MVKKFCAAAAIAALALSSGVAFAGEARGYALMIIAGQPDPNGVIPALSKVPNAGISNLDIAVPVAILQHGQPYIIIMASQNGSYSGTCTDSFTLTQEKSGKAVTLLSGEIQKYSCGQGQYWDWYKESEAIPNSPGPATLTGIVKYGIKPVTISVPVYIN